MKTIKTNILSIVIIVFLLAFGAISCGLWIAHKNVIKRTLNNANSNGYNIEQIDDNTFCIDNGGVKFYYEVGLLNLDFEKCEVQVEEKDVKVKDGDAYVIIKKHSKDTIKVIVDDSRIVFADDGGEKECYAYTFFLCDESFDKSSLVISKKIIDDEQKSLDAYAHVMRFLSVDELKGYYNESQMICDSLNE